MVTGGHNETAVAALLGGGVDFHTGRSWVIGLHAGYNAMTDFSRAVADERNFSGPEVKLSFSWMFGRGRTES